MGESATSFGYFTSRGYAVVSIQYSLSPYGYTVYDMFQDVSDAFAFIREHAAAWRVDVRRSVFWGGSAGGHLATVAAYRLIRSGACGADGIVGVLNLWGATELEFGAQQSDAWGEVVEEAVGVSYAEDPEAWRKASATHYVAPGSGLPPTVSYHGKWDTMAPFAMSKRLHEALAGASVPNLLVGIEMSDHVCDLGYSSMGGQIKRYVMERFLASVTTRPNANPINACPDARSNETVGGM